MFSYGVDHSPAFRDFLARGGQELTLAGLYLHRQVLGPYTNMLDGLPAPEATDLTAFAPRPRELEPALYEPAAVGPAPPLAAQRRRDARDQPRPAVARPTSYPSARSRRARPDCSIRPLRGRVPLAARVRRVPRDRRSPTRSGRWSDPTRRAYDPERDVVLEPGRRILHGRAARRDVQAGPGPAHGGVVRGGAHSTSRRTRSGVSRHPRQLRARLAGARVDGVPAPVLRANGKHRAVAIPAGRHEVVMRYEPPGLWIGIGLTALAALHVAVAVGPARGAPGDASADARTGAGSRSSAPGAGAR